jgi:UDP-2-acetamido-2,6-beta-L-arabino-hexul-4-ose reductase
MAASDWYHEPLIMHPDARGNFFEILRFKDKHVPPDGYTYCFTILPGQRRGDHLHHEKHEWFTCVSGEAVVLIEEREGTQHKLRLSAEQPALVYNAPYTAHAFYNESDVPAVLICYGSRQHDPADPDTFPKVITYEGV